jgi:lipopolysaccharide biosynthesis glycosyltransferase
MSTSIKNPAFLEKFGGRYFNSGVMLINLDRWRRDDMSGECERILLERPHDVKFWDQCLLNFACRPWLEISIEYNFYYGVAAKLAKRFAVQRRRFRAIASNPAIFHFVGPNKPWNKEPSDLHQLEKEYPLCRQAFEQVIAEQTWTGLSIHQRQHEARVAKRTALRRAERGQLHAEQRRFERRTLRRGVKRQARVDERRRKRQAVRRETFLAQAAEVRAHRKARRRQVRVAAQRLERKSLRIAERKALRSVTRLTEAAEMRAQRRALRRAARKAQRRRAQAEEERPERKRLRRPSQGGNGAQRPSTFTHSSG